MYTQTYNIRLLTFKLIERIDHLLHFGGWARQTEINILAFVTYRRRFTSLIRG